MNFVIFWHLIMVTCCKLF